MSLINWKELSLSDKELINSYYDREPVRNCEFTFANNILWKPFYEVHYAVVEDSLVFKSGDGDLSVSFPIGAKDVKAAIDALAEWFYQKKLPFKLHLVSPQQFSILEELWPGRFLAEYNRDEADYVYEREKLVKLSGKSYHGKKNHCNKFKSLYPDWCYEPITDANVQECKEMAQKWWRLNDDHEEGEKSEEIQVTMQALEQLGQLDLTGGLLRADGRVVAFAIGEPCGKDMFVVHFEKAFSDVPGAYSMINQQFAEHAMEGYRYVNREDDAGSEGLRRAKLSYHPVFLMEMGIVTEKENAYERN